MNWDATTRHTARVRTIDPGDTVVFGADEQGGASDLRAADHLGKRAMPWNLLYYPRAMEHLEPTTRAKAIEIANALLRDGHDEGFAIRVAISQAERWSLRHSPVGQSTDD